MDALFQNFEDRAQNLLKWIPSFKTNHTYDLEWLILNILVGLNFRFCGKYVRKLEKIENS